MAEIEDGKAKLESFAEDRKAWYSTFQTIVDSFRAEYEYYLLTEQEYLEFKRWPERKQWECMEEAFDWQHKNLEGKKQVLCCG